MVRTILTWRMLGERLVGTCHVPTPGRAAGLSGAPSVGILLLNPGSAPRSGNSDLSACLGDRLALRGFPVFRFDLPGLGDSSGSTPLDLDAYWSAVVDGRNDEATVALVERIRNEFGVERVVVGGLCAATLPAVRAIGRAGTAAAGLILLEPSLNLTLRKIPVGMQGFASAASPGPAAAGLGGALSVVGLVRGGWFARATSPLRTLLHSAAGRTTGRALPRDANLPLIALWRASLDKGVHSLVVVAAGHGTDRYVDRVLRSMPVRAQELVTCVRIPDTNHLFTSGAGRAGVLAAVDPWMTRNFGGLPDAVALQGSGHRP